MIFKFFQLRYLGKNSYHNSDCNPVALYPLIKYTLSKRYKTKKMETNKQKDKHTYAME
jgi:hypothetical protein